MAIELLTKEDVREILREELIRVLPDLLPKPDEAPVTGGKVCARFSISHVTLAKYRDLGKIPCIKIGKCYRYILSDVEEALTKVGLI